MGELILITGGAGFIGSHLADELLAHGHRVRALDSLVEQVHGPDARPTYLDPDVELVLGDVRDAGQAPDVERLGVGAVHHVARSQQPAVELLDGLAHSAIRSRSGVQLPSGSR